MSKYKRNSTGRNAGERWQNLGLQTEEIKTSGQIGERRVWEVEFFFNVVLLDTGNGRGNEAAWVSDLGLGVRLSAVQ